MGAAGSSTTLYLVAQGNSFAWRHDQGNDVVGSLVLTRQDNGDVTYLFPLAPENGDSPDDHSAFLGKLAQGDSVTSKIEIRASDSGSGIVMAGSGIEDLGLTSLDRLGISVGQDSVTLTGRQSDFAGGFPHGVGGVELTLETSFTPEPSVDSSVEDAVQTQVFLLQNNQEACSPARCLRAGSAWPRPAFYGSGGPLPGTGRARSGRTFRRRDGGGSAVCLLRRMPAEGAAAFFPGRSFPLQNRNAPRRFVGGRR